MRAVVLLCALRAAAWSPAPRAARAWASAERARSLPATREGADPEVTIRHLTEDLQDARDELEASRQKAVDEGRNPQYDGTWRDADPAEVQRRLDEGEFRQLVHDVQRFRSSQIEASSGQRRAGLR